MITSCSSIIFFEHASLVVCLRIESLAFSHSFSHSLSTYIIWSPPQNVFLINSNKYGSAVSLLSLSNKDRIFLDALQHESMIKLSLFRITTGPQYVLFIHTACLCLSDLNQEQSCMLIWLTGLLSCSEILRLFFLSLWWEQREKMVPEQTHTRWKLCTMHLIIVWYIMHWSKTDTGGYSTCPSVKNSAWTFCLLCKVMDPGKASIFHCTSWLFKYSTFILLFITNWLRNLWLFITRWKKDIKIFSIITVLVCITLKHCICLYTVLCLYSVQCQNNMWNMKNNHYCLGDCMMRIQFNPLNYYNSIFNYYFFIVELRKKKSLTIPKKYSNYVKYLLLKNTNRAFFSNIK